MSHNLSNTNSAAKYALIGTIITAVLTLAGVGINAYFNYRTSTIPIITTQTAEARLTENANGQINTPISIDSPTPIVTRSTEEDQNAPTNIPVPNVTPSSIPVPLAQEVQWIPDNDGIGSAGFCINSDSSVCPVTKEFIPWDQAKIELEQQVLPQVPEVISGSILNLRDGPYGEKNWIIEVISPTGEEIANIWVGNNPLKSWQYDGYIRVGYPYAPIAVWAIFERYSDNTYKRTQP